MLTFIEAGQLARLGQGKGATATAGNNPVALFNIDGVVHAIESCCLRCGACLADGSPESRVVACPGCDWRYDITTGSVIGIPALRLMIFDVKVVGGKVFICNV